jgi:nucleoside 2-deoxyribosyltransferase
MSDHQVFVAYSHDDAAWVRLFAEALRERSVDVCLDEWQIDLGDSLREAIETGLRSSDAIVAVLTQAGVGNPTVLFEMGVALGTGKRLIPIVPADLENSAIPFGLRTRRQLTKGAPGEAAREVAEALKGKAA